MADPVTHTAIAAELRPGDIIILATGERLAPVVETTSGLGGRIRIEYKDGKVGTCDPRWEFNVERESDDE